MIMDINFWEWIKSFILRFTLHVITYPYCDRLKSNDGSKEDQSAVRFVLEIRGQLRIADPQPLADEITYLFPNLKYGNG